jgi:aspartate 1-decarboxylase
VKSGRKGSISGHGLLPIPSQFQNPDFIVNNGSTEISTNWRDYPPPTITPIFSQNPNTLSPSNALSLHPFKLVKMQIEVLKSKIHRAVITDANLHYVGSCTIDEDLMDAAGMITHEKIQIVNVNNGARLETYIIKGERGSGVVALNGAAARLAQPGDIIIIMSYALLDFEAAKTHEPKVVFPKEGNKL